MLGGEKKQGRNHLKRGLPSLKKCSKKVSRKRNTRKSGRHGKNGGRETGKAYRGGQSQKKSGMPKAYPVSPKI